MNDELLSLISARRGHFQYESGHHGDLWFDLETLCLRPASLWPHVARLSDRIKKYNPEVVCGALVEGAFVALMVAQQLGCEFAYAGRFAPTDATGFYQVEYRVPTSLHAAVKGRRIAVVNDFINAGSAVRGALNDLQTIGAHVVAIGALVLLGDSFRSFASEHSLPLEALASLPNNLWTPSDCPLCRDSVPLEYPAIA